MSLTSSIREPIDNLTIALPARDRSAEELVPPLERDPLLIGLAQLAERYRRARSVGATSPTLRR